MEQSGPTDSQIEQRRRFRRIPVLWSGRLDRGEDETRCKILNLSPAGAKIQVEDIEPWHKRVRLLSHHFGELTGKIVWREHDRIGIAFSDSSERVHQAMADLVGEPSHAMA